jgi:hypothetical protein
MQATEYATDEWVVHSREREKKRVSQASLKRRGQRTECSRDKITTQAVLGGDIHVKGFQQHAITKDM